MSTKTKLLAMTEGLQLPPENAGVSAVQSEADGPAQEARAKDAPGPTTKFPPVGPTTAARTGPGQMLQFRGQMLAVEGELGKLRDQLKEHAGASPTKKLDPTAIVPSRWANRHPDSFNSSEFVRLKQDIELAGGNVQAIAVRPLADQLGRYEIVFGHRRHRACSELGLAVLATIDTTTVSDHDLFSAMDRENRERADLSPYEQGMMYRRALDEKLYPSNRRLAEALGVSHTWVANVLQVADLPPPVLDCFRSPLEVQPRHAKALAAAFEQDRKAVLRRAEKLRLQGKKLAPSVVVNALVGQPDDRKASAPVALQIKGHKVGSWFRDATGRLTIQLNSDVVSDDQIEAVVRSVTEALAR